MAIGATSRVRVKLTSAAFTGVSGFLQPQPPVFGRVTRITSEVVDVLTDNGLLYAVDRAFLDEITAASAPQLEAYLDKVVVGFLAAASSPFGSAYVGRVVDVFLSGGAARVLIKSLTNGMYYEMPLANVTVLGAR